MTLKRIFMSRLINDNTEVYIRSDYFNVITQGKWYNNNIISYLNCRVESFTWEDGNNLYIDIK